MEAEYITRDGKEYVLIPLKEYEKVVKILEEYKDLAKHEEEGSFPVEMKAIEKE